MNRMKAFMTRLGRVAAGFCAFLALGGIVLSAAGCRKKAPPATTPPRPVQAAKAITKDVPLFIESFGNLKAPYTVDVKSQVTGKIKECHFQEGDEVKAGDPLFTVDPEEYRADLKKARAALEANQAELKLKRQTLERNRQLFEKELISQQDYDTYLTEVAAAEAQVRLDQANLKLAKINLAYCSISSPIAGVTGMREVDPGNIVTANAGAALVNIKTIDPLFIDFTIPERNLPRVRERMAGSRLKVEIFPAGDPKAPYECELVFVDNTVDPETGTVFLRARVANPDRRFWPGQYVSLRLTVETEKGAVLVPETAVQLGQKGPYVYVITAENKADLRDSIEVGETIEGNVIIEKGVKAGERVATRGQMGLSPGVTVQITDGGKKSGSSGEASAGEKQAE